MAKTPKATSGSDARQYPRPCFDIDESAIKAALAVSPTSAPIEDEKERELFETRKNAEKEIIDALFESWLRLFACFWDSKEAFEADAPTVVAKWRALLQRHEATVGFAKTRREVAESVFNGRGFKGGGNLGGNPFCDVALLTAAAHNQSNAWRAFDAAYKEMLTAWAIKWASVKMNRGREIFEIADFEFWYDEFKSELYLRKAAQSYRGDAGLKIFLYRPLEQVLTAIAVRAFHLDQNDGLDETDETGKVGETGKTGEDGKVGEEGKIDATDKNGEDGKTNKTGKTGKTGKVASTVLPDVRRYDSVSDGEGGTDVVAPAETYEAEDDRRYWDRLIREGFDKAFVAMKPLKRQAFRLDCVRGKGATRRDVAQKLGISTEKANALVYSAWKEIQKVFARYDEALMDDLWKRLNSPDCVELTALLNRIDPETGEFLAS